MDDFCKEKGIKREYSVARTPQQNSVAERRNRTLIKAAITMLADFKLPTTFWAEAVTLSFMIPFGCHVTILNTLDNLGKFDGKSDEENKPMIEGNGPKWLFDIDSLTQSMNYVPVAASTISNESADALYFDSPSEYVGNGELKSVTDDKKQVKDGPHNESDEKDKFEDDSSPKEVNAVGQHINTASPKVNTSRFKLNIVDPSVNIASSYDPDSPKDMFKIGASHTLETTHVEFFSDEDEPEVDLGNITNFYTVPTTPNPRIHKDHPIRNVIGDVKSTIQIRRMKKSTSEQGLNPQALLKLYLIHLRWKQCKKNFCNSSSNRQEEGIDYKEVFTPVARIEVIRLFLAYASFMGFLVYQMDMKSAFLYGTIEEEVYVTQPPGFKDPDHPDKVYKVVKALYGLHQAPRAWYETLANYLLGNGFKRGKIDQTLFIKKQKGDILLIQVTQKEDGIFINQDKYVAEILKKFNYTNVKSASTLVDLEKPLVKDGDADDVDVHLYRSMIGSLMYLTASKPDIMLAVCACARFHVAPKTSHLLAIKRIFRYLKGKPTLGLWYSRDSPFELVAYTDSDYAGATQDRKSTTGDLLTKGFDAGRHVKRSRDTKIPQSSGPPVKVGDEAVHKELGDIMERAAITASSLEAEQDSATARITDDGEVEITATIDGQIKNITEVSLRRHLKLEDSDGITSLPNIEIFEQLALMGYVSGSARLAFQKGHFSPHWRVSSGYSGIDFPLFPKMITAPESSPSRITSSPSLSPQTHQSSPLRDITRQAAEIPHSHIPTYTQVADEATFTSMDVDVGGASTTDIGLDAGQGSGTIHKTPTRPYDSSLPRVYTLGGDEGSLQQNELMDLVTKLTDRLEKKVKTNKARRRARIVISKDEDAKEDSSKQGRKIFDIDKDPTISLVHPEQDMEYDFDVSTAERFTTASVPVTTASASVSTASATPEVSTAAANLMYIRRSAEKRKDKVKAIMKEDESVQKKSKKQLKQERLGHEEAIRLARQEQEVIAEADQAHDIDWSDPAVLRYHALQNRSFFVAEVRKNICMYLKNQGGYKLSHFKDSEIEKEVMKRPGFDFQQKFSKKRSREDSDEDNAKKHKLEDDAEKKELRDSMVVVPRDDIAIDVESLATKYLIVDWKTHVLTENMMQNVLDLHRLVQERYDTTSPEGYDLLLWGDLKIIFEPNEEDEIWKNQQDYNLISWRLFDSCGIHMLLMHTGIAIHMMIKKKYPLTQEMLSRMLSRRLEVDQESDMAFEH
ncbi:retrovirus-related pol polyprotein from transposon TNT 1-94 [Tanacetum coccineum]|uniref:Retrovirus-related pol polyprotein from transposon TNT 1-94 n=1 Tax=Tanacetum coccineum TaxID=301880 RepID=A0ABQ5DIG6_9ASTR